MANFTRKFESPSGDYNNGYISKVLEPQHKDQEVHVTRGIIQVDVLSGEVSLEGRLHRDAPWVPLKTWTQPAMEEVVLANQLRIVVSESAHAWLGEVR
ncbi:hypothetical protein RDp07_gp38 [Roseobacter phage RD-1410Ws-07]|uniref:Uncharacterized protein n=2 Tax=Sanyabayvirus DS1410Ws06 TaxID=2844087 RepID=A0A191VYR2_9CAUD|nr:hypothetical protein HYO98_gp41 [Dinoroseobacter phage DS-1410Ws-06]ANJ20698.1 hypothetical protein DSp06_gp41 [Dinoroseobacter phage DS-1410Ws-06]ANJ20849.1 hypothetical protein RDp07_gp38 [Roseobacter phage RD-1410Ws-07]